MNITLRKATQLISFIDDVVKSIDFTTTVEINRGDDANQILAQSTSKFANNLHRRDSLIAVKSELGKLVAKGYNVAEINDKLEDIKLLEEQISFFNCLVSNKYKINQKAIQTRLQSETAISTSIFEEDEIKGFHQMLIQSKKQKQFLEDQVLELTVMTELPVSDASASTLQKEGLV
jgi:hypothetical protein